MSRYIQPLSFAAILVALPTLKARAQFEIELVSVSNAGDQANTPTQGGVCRDGSVILMPSQATNLIDNDTNGGVWDLYVRDLQRDLTTVASVNSEGQQATHHCQFGIISATGRYVVFGTVSRNMIPGGSNGWQQVYLHDRETMQTEIVSLTPSGAHANGPCGVGGITPDGRFVTFGASFPQSEFGQLFIRDRLLSQTTLVVNVLAQFSGGGGLSDDGRFVVFITNATDLHPDATGEFAVYVQDRLLGKTIHASVPNNGPWPNAISYSAQISADGRYVAFASNASNLVPDDTNGVTDIFVRDLLLGETTRVNVSSTGEQSDGATLPGVNMTSDGRFVAFNSFATNLDDDVNGWLDGFVHDRWTGQTELVTLNWQGEQLYNWGGITGISDDGRLVSFASTDTTVLPQLLSGDYATFVRARWKLGDVNRDGTVNVVDLLAIINAWGPCPAAPPPPALPIPCDADVTSDNTVNVADLLLIINNWG